MEEKIRTMMCNLNLTREEALALIADDEEVDRMPMSRVVSDIEPAKKKKDTKEPTLTENQELVLTIMGGHKDLEFTERENAECSNEGLSSRGLGSIMRKLVELNLVERSEGRPVKYKMN